MILSRNYISLIRIRNVAFRRLSIATRPPKVIPYETGQPTHETRPHYIPTAGNLTPGISATEYYLRRLELSKRLPAKSLAILVGNSVRYSSGSVFYDFQQDNDFYYLTGWLEPNSVAIIEKHADSGSDEDVVFHMLVPDKNRYEELWEGQRLGVRGAYDFFNADHAEDIQRGKQYLANLIQRSDYIYWDDKESSKSLPFKLPSFFSFSRKEEEATSLRNAILQSNKKIKPLSKLVAEQRAIKSPSEIQVMHAAGQISSRAINKAMGKVGSDQPIITEKTLAKYLEYQFVKGGCDKQAYIPVVASGENALTIHYTRNDDLLYKDEMVFIDAGGKLGGYNADVSRTWPNSSDGFSEPQREIYEVVLNVNKKCIDLCSEDNGLSLHNLHEFSVSELHKELRRISGFEFITAGQLTRDLYPHYIGHHLGLDLHDVPTLSRTQRLVDGNVVTIEPGLYIPFKDAYPKAYQGIGVRVEDDVVVTKKNSQILNLTSGCVKEVKDIENLIKNGVTTPDLEKEMVILDI